MPSWLIAFDNVFRQHKYTFIDWAAEIYNLTGPHAETLFGIWFTSLIVSMGAIVWVGLERPYHELENESCSK